MVKCPRITCSWDNWKIRPVDDLRDTRSDYQIIGTARTLEFCNKGEEKALLALLVRRNECAHPSDYEPGLNETLGYVSEVLKRIEALQRRWSKAQSTSPRLRLALAVKDTRN